MTVIIADENWQQPGRGPIVYEPTESVRLDNDDNWRSPDELQPPAVEQGGTAIPTDQSLIFVESTPESNALASWSPVGTATSVNAAHVGPEAETLVGETHGHAEDRIAVELALAESQEQPQDLICVDCGLPTEATDRCSRCGGTHLGRPLTIREGPASFNHADSEDEDANGVPIVTESGAYRNPWVEVRVQQAPRQADVDQSVPVQQFLIGTPAPSDAQLTADDATEPVDSPPQNVNNQYTPSDSQAWRLWSPQREDLLRGSS